MRIKKPSHRLPRCSAYQESATLEVVPEKEKDALGCPRERVKREIVDGVNDVMLGLRATEWKVISDTWRLRN